MSVSRSQLDKVGYRLRSDETPSREDLETLAKYQRSLSPLREEAQAAMQAAFQAAAPNARFEPAPRDKQLRSIVAKLRREPGRLSTMQDLSGFRVVVPGIYEQQSVLQHVAATHPWTIVDRRMSPSHGYRAVHLIPRDHRGTIEIQLRTQLQHQWAEMSELLEREWPGIKYGSGPSSRQHALLTLSALIAVAEDQELSAYPMRILDMGELHNSLTVALDEIIAGSRGRNAESETS